MSTWAGHVDFGLSFHVLSISELVAFAVEFWGWVVLYSIVLSSMMLFKRSFGLTRSLFILYVHEHDRLGFGMLTVAAVFDCICWFSSSRDRKGQSYPVEYYLESVEEYSEGKIHKSEPEPGNGNVNTVYFVNQARRNTRISRTSVCLRWTYIHTYITFIKVSSRSSAYWH